MKRLCKDFRVHVMKIINYGKKEMMLMKGLMKIKKKVL